MANKQELLHIALRKDNGQIGYMSKGIPISEFYNLIQPKQQNINVNVLIDFYPVIDTIHSLLSKNQDDDTYIKFNSLYSYWNDAKTYKDKQIRVSSFNQLRLSSNYLLNILQKKLKENIYNGQEYSYQKLEKINNFIEYVDIYIETILCFIHLKASLDIESFQENNPYDSTLLQYLLLIKSTKELESLLQR